MRRYTSLHHGLPNGRITLAPQVLRLDEHRRICRRRRTWRELLFDVTLTWVVPAAVLLFVALCLIAIYWLGWSIDRAVRSLGGIS